MFNYTEVHLNIMDGSSEYKVLLNEDKQGCPSI